MARAGTIPCVGGGAAPVVLRPFTARPRSAHYGWEKRVRCADLLLCRVWGGAGLVTFRQNICFWRPRHAGSAPKSGEGSVMAQRLSVAGREELERRREFAVGAAVS